LLLLAPWSPLEPDAVAAGAAAVTAAVRDVDQPARVLPEGIVVLLPCTEGSDGEAAARRLVGAAERASRAAWCGGVVAIPGSPRLLDRFADVARAALEQARRLGPARVHLARQERRRHPRRVAAGAIQARIRCDALVFEVEVVDLSLQGALVESGTVMRVGDAIVLEVAERSPRGRSAEVAARILRSEALQQASRPLWRAALAFEAAASVLPSVTHILAGLAVEPMPEARP
jgi:hypothetical protein